jgi:hypothetical protein
VFDQQGRQKVKQTNGHEQYAPSDQGTEVVFFYKLFQLLPDQLEAAHSLALLTVSHQSTI